MPSRFTRGALRVTTSLLLLGLLAACSEDETDTPPVPPVQPLPSCAAAPNTLRTINAIQGSGKLSPLAEQLVSVRGVVTADFQADDQLKGFFIQQPDADKDPLTSDGLFVYAPGGADVKQGDYVQVSGKVVEFKSGSNEAERLTELSEVSAITVCGAGPRIAPQLIKLPLANKDALEASEGMLVAFNQTLTVSEVYQLGRYGELLLSAGGRLFQANNHPSAATPAEINAANALARIVLDDGRSIQNPKPIPYLSAADSSGTRRVGDTLNSVQGVLSWGADAFRVHPTVAPVFTASNPRPAAPLNVGGQIRASGLNVLNYFTTLGQRGANNEAEFQRQRAKLVETIVGLNADALGLMEIENNGTLALADLAAAVNAKLGAGTYAYIDAGKPGSDAITVAMLYKPTKLKPIGSPQVPNDPGFEVAGGLRPPVAQRFAALSNNGSFWLVVNHLKSKGSCPSAAGDVNLDQGQGCWNAARTTQATALKNWVATLSQQSGEADVLMVGDFNAYLNEDPIKTLEAAGHEALLKRLPANERYTYVFSGESGALDHAFASSNLRSQISGVTVWHVNAEEPLVLDYNTEFKTDDRYAATPYRSSDHDPVLVGLNLNADAPVIAPSLNATLPSAGSVGSAVSISAISAQDGSALSVDWGDGTQESLALTASSASHTYAAAGNYTVSLVLSGAGGMSATRSATLTISAVTPPASGAALFFSEYVEGSSNNKALEIYNPSSTAVDLSDYSVKLFSNGATSATQTQALSGSLAAGQTLVLVHAQFAGSVAGSVVSAVTNFNGDDALTLEYRAAVIDAIGQVGFDPGTEWKSGSHSTLNKTLRRKAGIVQGSVPPTAPASWDLSSEWELLDIDSFAGLGSR